MTKKIQWKKFKMLPNYKILTIWYDNKGKIKNCDRIDREEENYFIRDVVSMGRQDNENFVDYFCKKRNKPRSTSIW